MHIYCRYLSYAMLLMLGACALGSSVDETRSDWGTIFADATAGKTKVASSDDIASASKGGKR